MNIGFWNGLRTRGMALRGLMAGGAAKSSILTGLLSYWKLDEASAGAAPVTRNDSIGTLHLTDTNNTPSAAGKVSNAASFVKASTRVLSSAATTVLAAGAGVSFELALWVRRTAAAGTVGLVSKNGNWLLDYNVTADRFRWVCRKGNNSASVILAADALGAPALNTWYFVNIWHDAANDVIGIRVNDQYQNTSAYTFDVYHSSSAFYIGFEYAGSNYLTGLVDEVGFWQRVLTAAERTYLYNLGNGRTLP